MRKLGLVAGGGDLPTRLAANCTAIGRRVFVLRLRGLADLGATDFAQGSDVGLGEFGRCFELLRRHECEVVCFAGNVARPDFGALRFDLRGLAALPRLIAAAARGDDALLRAVLAEFEREGFTIEGAQQVDGDLLLSQGPLAGVTPEPSHAEDIAHALRVARAIGRYDIGQAAVVVRGLVLAVEAQEGTDAMLRRCADLPPSIRGARSAPLGVLAKAPKPVQERRVDLPTLGIATVEAAAAAGLAGIVGEAGGVLIVDRAGVAAAADRLGLFVIGVTAEGEPS